MLIHPRLFVLALTVLPSLCLGCWHDSRQPDVTYGTETRRTDWISTGDSSHADDRDATLPIGPTDLVVPPDRVVLEVHLRSFSTSPSATSESIRLAAASLAAKLSRPADCRANVTNYGALEKHGDERWLGTATLELEADLREVSTVDARLMRVERCLTALEEASLEEAEVRVGPPHFTVDDPARHRAALLAHALRPLGEVAEVRALPPQFDPLATRCTSTGNVTITERRMRGVRLSIDLSCATRPLGPEGAPVAVAVSPPA
jgi:hypothetical protein